MTLKTALGDELGLVGVWLNLGLIASEREDWGTAHARCRQARRLAHRLGAPEAEAQATLGQATVALRRGRRRAAAALIAHGTRLVQGQGYSLLAIRLALCLAELQRQRGAIEEAGRAARDVWRHAVVYGFHREEARAQLLLGRCVADLGTRTEAESCMRIAEKLFAEMGATIEVARVQRAIAELGAPPRVRAPKALGAAPVDRPS